MESPKKLRTAGKLRAAAQHADAIAELEHQVVVGQQIGVAAAHVDVAVVEAAGNLQAAERHADDAALRGEDADVVERGPVRRELARGALADQRARLVDRGGIGADDEQHVVGAENR